MRIASACCAFGSRSRRLGQSMFATDATHSPRNSCGMSGTSTVAGSTSTQAGCGSSCDPHAASAIAATPPRSREMVRRSVKVDRVRAGARVDRQASGLLPDSEFARCGRAGRPRSTTRECNDSNNPWRAGRPRSTTRECNDSKISGPRASGPPCDRRLEQPVAGGTPAGHHTRVQRLEDQWTAGLWPAVRSTTRTTRGGRDARGPSHASATTRRSVDRGPLARRAIDDSNNPWRAGRPRAITRECNDSKISGPRASDPPCDRRLEQPVAGGTPAVHHTRVQRLEDQWTAGLWPAVRSTTRTTRGGRDARGPPHASATTRRSVDRGPLARRAIDDSNNPWRAGRPRAITRECNDSKISGPRASDPPCDRRLEQPVAGGTPAGHRPTRGPRWGHLRPPKLRHPLAAETQSQYPSRLLQVLP